MRCGQGIVNRVNSAVGVVPYFPNCAEGPANCVNHSAFASPVGTPTVPFTPPVELSALPNQTFLDDMAYSSATVLGASGYTANDLDGWYTVSRVATLGPRLAITPDPLPDGQPDGYAMVALPLYLATAAPKVWAEVDVTLSLSDTPPGNPSPLLQLMVQARGPGAWGWLRIGGDAVAPHAPYLETYAINNAYESRQAPLPVQVRAVRRCTLYVERLPAAAGMRVVTWLDGVLVHDLVGGPATAPLGDFDLVTLTIARNQYAAGPLTEGVDAVAALRVRAGALATNPFGVTLPA